MGAYSMRNPASQPSHRASMNEVAQKAGVSHQTVSRVINNSPNVSRATRQRVEQVIRELNYRPSNSARALVTRHTKTIGFIAGGVNYYGPISTMASIESVAREHGFYLSVAIIDEREYTRQAFEEIADSFLDQGVEAFLFLAPTVAMVEAAVSATINQPRVILTSTFEEQERAMKESFTSSRSSSSPAETRRSLESVRFVGIDQMAAAHKVIDYLSELGHRDCVFFSGPEDWGDAAMRLKAWQRYSHELGWNARTLVMTSWDASEAYDAARKLISTTPREQLPTVVVASNDLQAFGVSKAFHEAGVRVPEDVSVVGFDDVPGADFHVPSLTTVRPDFEALGRSAMQKLLGMLGIGEDSQTAGGMNDVEAAKGGSNETSEQGIGSELIVRESSAAPRKK